MKKYLFSFVFLLLLASNVFSQATSETGDTRTVPVTLYGKQSDGTITAILVDSDGKMDISNEFSGDTTVDGNLSVGNVIILGPNGSGRIRDNGGGDLEFSENSGGSWTDFGSGGGSSPWTDTAGGAFISGDVSVVGNVSTSNDLSVTRDIYADQIFFTYDGNTHQDLEAKILGLTESGTFVGTADDGTSNALKLEGGIDDVDFDSSSNLTVGTLYVDTLEGSEFNFQGDIIVQGNTTVQDLTVNKNVSIAQDLTVNGLIFAPNAKQYSYLTLSGDQTSPNPSTDTVVALEQNIGNMNVSSNQISLKANVTYKLMASLRIISGSADFNEIAWYDVTNAAYLEAGGISYLYAVTWSASHRHIQPITFLVISPSTDIAVELRFKTEGDADTVEDKGTWAWVESIFP